MGWTQIILVILFYAMSSAISSGQLYKWGTFGKGKTSNTNGAIDIKAILYRVLTGIGGLLAIDLMSNGNPVWPALGLLAGFGGEIYPWAKVSQRADIGVVYFGAIFYLLPLTAIVSVGMVLPSLILAHDHLLSLILWLGAVPVLFQYSQVNPWFFGASLVVEVVALICFRNVLWRRLVQPK